MLNNLGENLLTYNPSKCKSLLFQRDFIKNLTDLRIIKLLKLKKFICVICKFIKIKLWFL